MKIKYEILDKEMARQCLSVTDLSKITGLAVSTITRVRTPGMDIRTKTVGLIAKALNINIDILVIE